MAASREHQYLREMAEQGYSADNIDPFHLVMIPYLLNRHGIAQSEKIVEIGPAHGHCLISAYRAGYRNLGAVDYCDANFVQFQGEYNVECHKADIVKEKLPLESDSIGAFLFFHTIEHISDPFPCLNEMLRCLKPGGWAFVVTPDWRKRYRDFYADPTHIRPYDKQGLSRLMRIVGWQTIQAYSWGSAYGLGRLKAFKFFPRLGMIGQDILITGQK